MKKKCAYKAFEKWAREHQKEFEDKAIEVDGLLVHMEEIVSYAGKFTVRYYKKTKNENIHRSRDKKQS